MINLCAMEPLETLTPVQRLAALAFWYMSEVNNGGHFQYFINLGSHPHEEVVLSLEAIGAHHSARVLASALEHLGEDLPHSPASPEEYLRFEEIWDLSAFDSEWGEKGDTEINMCLEKLLAAHEREFVIWQD